MIVRECQISDVGGRVAKRCKLRQQRPGDGECSLLGGLELAGEESVPQQEAFAVARESAVVLRRRVELLRLAWGQHVEALSIPNLRTLLAG